MPLPLDWMADVLRGAGVPVVEYPGWRTRYRADGPYNPRAVMWHHDASAPGPSPSVPDFLASPANNGAQCWVDTAGAWWLIAAGRMWHAGTGISWGVIPANAGNTYAIGIETDHTVNEAWPSAQLSSLRRGTAALMRRLGASPHNALVGHKEYAPGRKIDPAGLDMNVERPIVADLIASPPPLEEDDAMHAWDLPAGDGIIRTLSFDPIGEGQVFPPGSRAWFRLYCFNPADIDGSVGEVNWLVFAGARDVAIDPFNLVSRRPYLFDVPAGTLAIELRYSSRVPVGASLVWKRP